VSLIVQSRTAIRAYRPKEAFFLVVPDSAYRHTKSIRDFTDFVFGHHALLLLDPEMEKTIYLFLFQERMLRHSTIGGDVLNH